MKCREYGEPWVGKGVELSGNAGEVGKIAAGQPTATRGSGRSATFIAAKIGNVSEFFSPPAVVRLK